MSALLHSRTAAADAEKPVPLDPPASRVPAVRDRAIRLEAELAALALRQAAAVLACAEGAPRAAAALADLHHKIALAEFELAGNGAARDLAEKLDQASLETWRADVQTLPPDEIVGGITRDGCCRRCRPGDCVIAGANRIPSECVHPVKSGPLRFDAHTRNPIIVAAWKAALAETGPRR
jgi:hypothetical protein